MAVPPPPVREPKQARSREAWERVLDVGLKLLEEGGVGALTITEVCRRSGINPPSLYARVDGKAGLFAAVYERGMIRVQETEESAFAGLPRPGAPVTAQASDAADAVADVFATHASFLRPVIGQAEADPHLLERGALESRRLLGRVASAICLDHGVAWEIAQTIYAECVVRTMYGAEFFNDTPETESAFRARLARTAAARAALSSPR